MMVGVALYAGQLLVDTNGKRFVVMPDPAIVPPLPIESFTTIRVEWTKHGPRETYVLYDEHWCNIRNDLRHEPWELDRIYGFQILALPHEADVAWVRE